MEISMNRQQWQTIVNEFHQSGLTKRAFAEQRKVVYSQLLYWIREYDAKQDTVKSKSDDLVPVKFKPDLPTLKQDAVLGVIEFPNGASLRIYSPELLTMLPSLLQG
jgi:hypothetical protein